MNDPFEQRARELLQESAQSLDGRLRSRLTQARYAALAALPANAAAAGQPRAAALWRRWIPAGAVAGATLLALLLVNQPGMLPGVFKGSATVPAATLAAASGIDDLDLLADNDAVEMSDMPDYDFYEWADAEAEGT